MVAVVVDVRSQWRGPGGTQSRLQLGGERVLEIDERVIVQFRHGDGRRVNALSAAALGLVVDLVEYTLVVLFDDGLALPARARHCARVRPSTSQLVIAAGRRSRIVSRANFASAGAVKVREAAGRNHLSMKLESRMGVPQAVVNT